MRLSILAAQSLVFCWYVCSILLIIVIRSHAYHDTTTNQSLPSNTVFRFLAPMLALQLFQGIAIKGSGKRWAIVDSVALFHCHALPPMIEMAMIQVRSTTHSIMCAQLPVVLENFCMTIALGLSRSPLPFPCTCILSLDRLKHIARS